MLYGTIAINAANFFATLFSCLVIEKVGRRIMLIIGISVIVVSYAWIVIVQN